MVFATNFMEFYVKPQNTNSYVSVPDWGFLNGLESFGPSQLSFLQLFFFFSFLNPILLQWGVLPSHDVESSDRKSFRGLGKFEKCNSLE